MSLNVSDSDSFPTQFECDSDYEEPELDYTSEHIRRDIIHRIITDYNDVIGNMFIIEDINEYQYDSLYESSGKIEDKLLENIDKESDIFTEKEVEDIIKDINYPIYEIDIKNLIFKRVMKCLKTKLRFKDPSI